MKSRLIPNFLSRRGYLANSQGRYWFSNRNFIFDEELDEKEDLVKLELINKSIGISNVNDSTFFTNRIATDHAKQILDINSTTTLMDFLDTNPAEYSLRSYDLFFKKANSIVNKIQNNYLKVVFGEKRQIFIHHMIKKCFESGTDHNIVNMLQLLGNISKRINIHGKLFLLNDQDLSKFKEPIQIKIEHNVFDLSSLISLCESLNNLHLIELMNLTIEKIMANIKKDYKKIIVLEEKLIIRLFHILTIYWKDSEFLKQFFEKTVLNHTVWHSFCCYHKFELIDCLLISNIQDSKLVRRLIVTILNKLNSELYEGLFQADNEVVKLLYLMINPKFKEIVYDFPRITNKLILSLDSITIDRFELMMTLTHFLISLFDREISDTEISIKESCLKILQKDFCLKKITIFNNKEMKTKTSQLQNMLVKHPTLVKHFKKFCSDFFDMSLENNNLSVLIFFVDEQKIIQSLNHLLESDPLVINGQKDRISYLNMLRNNLIDREFKTIRTFKYCQKMIYDHLYNEELCLEFLENLTEFNNITFNTFTYVMSVIYGRSKFKHMYEHYLMYSKTSINQLFNSIKNADCNFRCLELVIIDLMLINESNITMISHYLHHHLLRFIEFNYRFSQNKDLYFEKMTLLFAEECSVLKNKTFYDIVTILCIKMLQISNEHPLVDSLSVAYFNYHEKNKVPVNPYLNFLFNQINS